MTRYFFDVVSAGRCERDALGTSLPNRQEAHKWAQLLALALESAGAEQEIAGGRIGVRGSDGGELFSVPIRRRESPLAARSRTGFLRRINAACASKLWITVRGRWLGAKTPELASEDSGKGASI